MSSYALPFPGRDLAEKELSYDPCCPRIPEADRARIVDAAWEKGCAAARDVFAQSGGSADFFAICKANGLTVVERDIDFVSGNPRYFSDYVAGSACTLAHTTGQPLCRLDGSKLRRFEPTSLPQK